jgi:hypothetical protein
MLFKRWFKPRYDRTADYISPEYSTIIIMISSDKVSKVDDNIFDAFLLYLRCARRIIRKMRHVFIVSNDR